MSTLILNRMEVRDLLNMPAIIRVVEQAFRDLTMGQTVMPVKSYISLEMGDFRAMPAAIPGAVGIKWVNVHPQNLANNLPTVMAIIIYSDPATGYPLAVIDATDITAYRTGATAAIASKYLARPDSHTLGLIGAGRQAHTQLMAHAALFDLKLVKVFDPIQGAVTRFVKAFPGLNVRADSAEEAMNSDIVCTVTPARLPIVSQVWVKPGTHINAIGADAEGKEELEPAILNRATVVVDEVKQASMAGEINVPVAKGLFRVSDIYATLGEIISGRKPGRTDTGAITVFDATGLAIEDVAVARLIYETARQQGRGLAVNMVEEAKP